MRLKISARKSDLARLQAYRVADALKEKNPKIEIEFQFKESLGDKNLQDPLWKLPEKGVFTEDFYQELLSGATDIVVHSWKDLPTELKSETVIAATLPRADQRDLLFVKKSDFTDLKKNRKIRIFSSSPRRAYNLSPFLLQALPLGLESVEFEPVRGNISTRIRKMMDSNTVSGLIVAKAAIDRLLSAPEPEFQSGQKQIRESLQSLEWMVLPLSVNPNAAAQGALAIEVLRSRKDLSDLLSHINDVESFQAVQQERQVLSQHGGGCHQKIGVAVLPRKFGTLQICRGLTDRGQILSQNEILKSSPHRFSENEMWSADSDSLFSRESLPFTGLAKEVNSVFVSKAQAWPETLVFQGLVWTAGVGTWKKLASRGIWVHGTQDGLGENEPELLETLPQQPLRWAKLTHTAGVVEDGKVNVATYRLVPKAAGDFSGKKSFFWSSGSQFLRATEIDPSIVDRVHACGPGHTARTISTKVKNLEVFLNVEEWKQKCKI